MQPFLSFCLRKGINRREGKNSGGYNRFTCRDKSFTGCWGEVGLSHITFKGRRPQGSVAFEAASTLQRYNDDEGILLYDIASAQTNKKITFAATLMCGVGDSAVASQTCTAR